MQNDEIRQTVIDIKKDCREAMRRGLEKDQARVDDAFFKEFLKAALRDKDNGKA